MKQQQEKAEAWFKRFKRVHKFRIAQHTKEMEKENPEGKSGCVGRSLGWWITPQWRNSQACWRVRRSEREWESGQRHRKCAAFLRVYLVCECVYVYQAQTTRSVAWLEADSPLCYAPFFSLILAKTDRMQKLEL